MQFNSVLFFLFFAICFTIYYGIPVKEKKWLLLISSLFFYSFFSVNAVAGLVAIAVVSWLGEHAIKKWRKKSVLFFFLACTLLPLITLKYFNLLPGFVLPVGISFFTLQAISGMVDIYRKNLDTDDFAEHLLYLSFFPTVVSGPIIRKPDFLEQLHKPKAFDYEEVRIGFYRMAIGFVEKYFLADHIGRLVDYVYENTPEVTGTQIAVATIFFGLQLYYDFAGYSHMAIGFAKCFGITIMENFERPYFSVSIKEFWRRWHISLSSWLRDYVYIPLGGSRKGKIRKYSNLIITFLVSGMWHGVGLNFLFWGFLHGIYQVVEDVLFERRDKQSSCGIAALNSLIKMVVVFVLVDFAWLFFRATNMTVAIQMVGKLFSDFRLSSLFTTWWFDYGMSKIEYIMWFGVAIGVLILDICEEKKKEFLLHFTRNKLWLRWCVYAIVISILVITFVIGIGSNTNSFLYQNF